jgi:hypothetical protein
LIEDRRQRVHEVDRLGGARRFARPVPADEHRQARLQARLVVDVLVQSHMRARVVDEGPAQGASLHVADRARRHLVLELAVEQAGQVDLEGGARTGFEVVAGVE